MGANGHVVIYDYDKCAADLGEANVNKLTCSTVYIQELQGNKYLTSYHGDNLYDRGDDWSDMFGWVQHVTEADTDWYIDKKTFEKMWETIHKHRITSWEVWT